ncbi:hypothetical protein [Aridibaculum aurantiacum]|uniref:HU domain-containing protein n=1 Tax=Aridibaculum aurantiacum TaxID=2810307 RepID=UPI001A96A286|nr:hypothetical protein [Aridibaculum aurantiacum]
MYPLLYKYLMLHEQVCIPGVGRFFKERTAARQDFINKVYQPPVFTISFREEPVKADKQFYDFLSKERGINEVEAIRSFQDFSYRFQQHVKKFSITELPGIGVIRKNEEGRLSFQQDELLRKYFPPVPLEPTVRPSEEHALLVGNTHTSSTEMQAKLEAAEETKAKGMWWIWALIIGVIAIAAIAYYFYINGNIRL